MRRRSADFRGIVAAAATAALGCGFSPSYPTGQPCGPESKCPPGQICTEGVCHQNDDPSDASPGSDGSLATKYPGACRTERREAVSGSLLNKSEKHYEMDRLARELSDSDADGTWDSEETFKYDENDRLSTQERDSDRDGALDVILRYEYSGSSSNWLRTVRDVPEPSWMDLGDGDQVTTATYNARDLLTETVVEDCPCDGPPIDEVRRQVRSYDAADQLILLTTIRSSDQETTREERYFYSEAGRLIRTELDLSGTDGPFPDGVPETINTHHYEDGVNISRRDVDTDADGNVDDQVFYFYDCHDE